MKFKILVIILAVCIVHALPSHSFSIPWLKKKEADSQEPDRQLPPAMQIPDIPSDYMNPFAFKSKARIHNGNLPTAEFKNPTKQELERRQNRIKFQRSINQNTAASMTVDFEIDSVGDDDGMHEDDSPMSVHNAKEGDLVALEGFEFCYMLDKSTFWKNALLKPVLSSDIDRLIDETNVDIMTIEEMGYDKFVSFIDNVARQVVKDLFKYRSQDAEKAERGHLKRLACFLAADGRNSYLRYGQRKLLANVFGRNWFPEMNWANPAIAHETPLINVLNGKESILPFDNRPIRIDHKPHYPLVFSILIHSNLNGLKYLLKTLHRSNVFIIIHVDAKFPEFRLEVMKLISSKKKWRKNVKLTDYSYKCQWGVATIVHAQLLSYFELLDMITFEYVINISGNDAPLMDPDVMYHYLRNKNYNAQANYLSSLHGSSAKNIKDNYDRLNRPATLLTRQMEPMFGDNVHDFVSDLGISSYEGYRYYSTDQWHILTYAFLYSLRHDSVAPTLLVSLEFGYLVDEMYFSIYAQWNDRWSSTIENEKTRCIIYSADGGGHPKIDDKSYLQLKACVNEKKFLARKWWIDDNPKLKKKLSVLRLKARMASGISEPWYKRYWHKAKDIFYRTKSQIKSKLFSYNSVDK